MLSQLLLCVANLVETMFVVLCMVTLQGCTRQAALERHDLSCTYLDHHELESEFIIIIVA